MTEKIKSEIIRIDLADASYKDSHAYIEPTYVNFFFGNNGAGKSTIAKAIKNGAGVTYAPGRTSADYLPLVYNQEFIDENLSSHILEFAESNGLSTDVASLVSELSVGILSMGTDDDDNDDSDKTKKFNFFTGEVED